MRFSYSDAKVSVFCQAMVVMLAGAGIAEAKTPLAYQPFTASELDQLASAIALYPDSLVAQLLPASTHPLDVVIAYQWLRAHPNSPDSSVAGQQWDRSILAIAHYPSVLELLAENIAWAQELGDAYTHQAADLNRAIQRLRAQARTAGSLITTPQQRVVSDNNNIEIESPSPDVIYIPVYESTDCYTHRQLPHFDKPVPAAPLSNPTPTSPTASIARTNPLTPPMRQTIIAPKGRNPNAPTIIINTSDAGNDASSGSSSDNGAGTAPVTNSGTGTAADVSNPTQAVAAPIKTDQTPAPAPTPTPTSISVTAPLAQPPVQQIESSRSEPVHSEVRQSVNR